MTSTAQTPTIAIAADHAGYEMKQSIQKKFPHIQWIDLGTASTDRVDYPDYATLVATAIQQGRAQQGILICGSGIGMSIAANKLSGIRAAHVESEIAARLSRAHNDANILCLGSRITGPDTICSIIDVWLSTPFEGGRHSGRIQKISQLAKS